MALASMMKNPVQFQKGLGLLEFLAQYSDEQKCRDALFRLRWPSGFVCPECGGHSHCELKSRRLYQCNRCHHQSSLTAGTIFHGTRVPLRKWFLAIYLLTQPKKSLSALELKRQLGVHYDTAWSLKHKLMQVMYERQQQKKLRGRIEMDDAYLGGEKPGKRGRGSENKIPFVAAVQTHEGKPGPMQMRRVEGFRTAAISAYAHQALEPGSRVVSDGLSCFTGVCAAGCQHQSIITGSGRQATQHPAFKWVNTVLGNVKSAIRGTFHAVSEKHAPRYLAEFEYRFNRRFHLPDMIERLLYVSLRTPPMPYRLLTLAEPIR
jgi:transposase-like protein